MIKFIMSHNMYRNTETLEAKMCCINIKLNWLYKRVQLSEQPPACDLVNEQICKHA